MTKVFIDSTSGHAYPWPTNKATALALGLPRWLDLAGCAQCPEPGPKVRYTDDASTCVGCLLRSAPLTVELFRQGMPGMPEPFPLTPGEASAAGVTWFYGGDPELGLVCSRGAHIRKTDVASRRCLACREEAARRRAQGQTTPQQDARRSESSVFASMAPDTILSRADAKALGFTQYRTGVPCSRGHTGWRHTASGACVECRKLNDRRGKGQR